MCGIVGVLDTNKQTSATNVAAMANALSHRGPDDSGSWENDDASVLFGFRRLAFFDLTAAGHQPMRFDGLSIVFNGELYNHTEVRQELLALGHSFVGSSDTETLLHAWRVWGSAAIHRFRGMFAFVLYDERTGQLQIYRDRFGVKPLYYYQHDGLFACASEIKALLKHPQIAATRTIDTDALALFLQLSYIPAPWSIFRNIRKLEPAHFLTVSPDGRIEKTRYWDINDHYINDASRTKEALINELERRCQEAFSLRMLADRPVGMFLSGGIDSSVVAGLLANGGSSNLETFTIGFEEAAYDEATHAARVAEHLKTNHHERRCTSEEARAIIPALPELYDEPFGDASGIPTYLVSQFAREQVVASLSADGGDELFGGYSSYRSTMSFLRLAQRFSFPGLVFVLAAMLPLIRIATRWRILPSVWVHKFEKAAQLYPLRGDVPRLFARMQSHFGFAEVKRLMRMQPSVSSEDVFATHAPKEEIGVHRTLQHLDLHLYMTDDILVKVDRATMAHSLEGREPLLDHELAEYIAGIPESQLVDPAVGKHLLREVLYRHVPRKLVDRPKQGFGVPLNDWLKRDLRHLLDRYLNRERIEREGILNTAMVMREKKDFLSGRRPHTRVWNLIVFEMWYERWMQDIA